MATAAKAHPDHPGRRAKRTAILEAAATLFSGRGFHDTRVEEIAGRAGVAKGTVYEYFPSKEDLFKGIVSLAVERFIEAAREATRVHGEARAQLTALLESARTFAMTHRSLARMILENPPAIGEDLTAIVLQSHVRVRRIFQQVIEHGIATGEFRPVDAALAAIAVMGVSKGLVGHWLFGEPAPAAFPPEAAGSTLEQVLDLLLHGLSTPPEGDRVKPTPAPAPGAPLPPPRPPDPHG